MTIKHLDTVLNPQSVALIGATQTPGRVGNIIAKNMVQGGYQGTLYALNPKYREVEGIPCFASLKDLPSIPDLAVIATPAHSVPGLVAELSELGVKGAVITSAGFGEGNDPEGLALRQATLEASQRSGLRLFGPNCVGLLLPRILLNASFAHKAPKGGNLAVLAQSGAVLTGLIDWASEQNIGFSVMASMGAMADVDFGDMLNYLVDDKSTDAILMYIESVSEARKFMSAARAAARVKPVIVLKAGRTDVGSKAASSHTGALAGSDAVYDAAFARAGLLRVDSMEGLFEAAELLSRRSKCEGERLAILTNGGGFGVMAADALVQSGGQLAELSEETVERLNRVLPSTWSHANPIDIIGDAPAERYADALKILESAPECDAVLAMHCPVATVNAGQLAGAIAEACQGWQKPLISAWIGGHHMSGAREQFAHHGIPCYSSPDAAVDAFMQLQRHQRNQTLLLETPQHLPEHFEPDAAAAKAAIDEAIEQKRRWLTQAQVQRVFDAYQIPLARLAFATTPEQAADIAESLSCSVALKIASKDITHKSDVGGVLLNLNGRDAVYSAATHMLKQLTQQFPDARIDGFDVQTMVDRSDAYELILGMTQDNIFGPVMLVGHGGVATEVLADTTLALPPLNMKIARNMVAQTRIGRLLEGYRDRPAADIQGLCGTLVKLSQMVADLGRIAEFDINPLLVSEHSVIALDCRIRVTAAADGGAEHFAITPYPSQWVQRGIQHAGASYKIRPIRAEDEAKLRAWSALLGRDGLRLHFHQPIRHLNHRLAARLSQVDFDREMVFLLMDESDDSLIGVARLVSDPLAEQAEFALQLDPLYWQQGLGELLAKTCIRYAKAKGYQTLFGMVERDNTAMLTLVQGLGFTLLKPTGQPILANLTL